MRGARGQATDSVHAGLRLPYILVFHLKNTLISSQLACVNYYYATVHNMALQVPRTSREFPSRLLNNHDFAQS